MDKVFVDKEDSGEGLERGVRVICNSPSLMVAVRLEK